MVLIDTSVWIESFRRNGSLLIKRAVAEHISDSTAAYTCPILYELHAGAQTGETPLIERTLGHCTRLVLTEAHWKGAADLANRLLRKGATLSQGDVLIAHVAIESSIPILCRDKHFNLIRKVVGTSLEVQQIE